MMEFHPAADILPLMKGESFTDLVESIRENGLLEPVVLHDGQILDGRNRWRACQEAGVEPDFADWDGECGTPARYVFAKNIPRRHLTVDQLAMLGAELLEYERKEARKRQGARTDLDEEPVRKDAQKFPQRASDRAGAAVGVSGRTVEKAAKLRERSPEKAEEVKSGNGTVAQLLREMDVEPLLAQFPEDEQEHAKEFLAQPSLAPDSREKAAENLAAMPTEDRMRIYGLSEGTAKDKSLARTEALQLPPEPDARVVAVRAMVKNLERYTGHFGSVADVHFQAAKESLESALDAMREHGT